MNGQRTICEATQRNPESQWLLYSGNAVCFNAGIGIPGFYIYTHGKEVVHGRTFNAALRRFLKGVGGVRVSQKNVAVFRTTTESGLPADVNLEGLTGTTSARKTHTFSCSEALNVNHGFTDASKGPAIDAGSAEKAR